MSKFEIACEKCFAFISGNNVKQNDYLEYCFENNLSVKEVEKYVNKNYEKFSQWYG